MTVPSSIMSSTLCTNVPPNVPNKTEWYPGQRKYSLALADEEEKILDYIDLKIRRLDVDQMFSDEDEKGVPTH